MFLSTAIIKASSAAAFNAIFNNPVAVEIGWFNDAISVQGYQGSVTSDFIALQVMTICFQATPDTRELAETLATKVFLPLKDLVESPGNQCRLYQLSALMRITWTPPPGEEFGKAAALKHATVLGLLDPAYA